MQKDFSLSFDMNRSVHHSEDARQRSYSVETPLTHSKMEACTSSTHNTMIASRYKTELCRPYQEYRYCKYGDKCQFAHGLHDLRPLPRHPKYKTELCRTFYSNGFCPYGSRCHFIHSKGEARPGRGHPVPPPFTNQTSSSSFPISVKRPPLSPSQDSGISSPDELSSATFFPSGSSSKTFDFQLSDENDVDALFYDGLTPSHAQSPADVCFSDIDGCSLDSQSPSKPLPSETALTEKMSTISLDDELFSSTSRSRLPIFGMLNSYSDTSLLNHDQSWS